MKSRKINKIRMRETLVSYAFLLPAMLFFVLFVLVPMGMGVVTSFFRYNMKGMTFTGLSNYMTMFADPVWQKSLVNTLLLVVGSVPITVLFALFVAAMTYEKNPFTRSFFRCVFFLPVVTGTVAVTVVWKWIYDNDREIYGQFTPVYMRHGAGALRRLDEESLAEINEIFKVSGGSEMFDTIERHSDRKAREMGYEEGADQQYMMDVFLSNSNEHY